jgi:tryptophan-rich sensory protein
MLGEAGDQWYDELPRAPWQPRSRGTLAVLWALATPVEAVAAWLLWRSNGALWWTLALLFWFAQGTLRLVWPSIFYGLHFVDAGAVLLTLIVVLAGASSACMALAGEITACALMTAYGVWLAYLWSLNLYTAVRLRPRRSEETPPTTIIPTRPLPRGLRV